MLRVQKIGGRNTMITIVCPILEFIMGELNDWDDFFVIEIDQYDYFMGDKWLQKFGE